MKVLELGSVVLFDSVASGGLVCEFCSSLRAALEVLKKKKKKKEEFFFV